MKLKELRKANGMTRAQLSKAIQIPERTISLSINRKKLLSPEKYA